MKKILLSVFTILTVQFSFAQNDVLNFYSNGVIQYRNYVNKIDSVIFRKSTVDSVFVYCGKEWKYWGGYGASVKYKNSTAKIDSMNFSIFYACNVPRSLEVVIGPQTWSTTNLNVDKFRNGDVIMEAKTNEEWISAGNAGTPAWCYYLNSVDSGAKYGKLYNCYAVTDPRGLAPIGWHVPSYAELAVLKTSLGFNAGDYMKEECGWLPYQNGYWGDNGSNSSGFSLLPSGMRSKYDGTFEKVGSYAYLWSSTALENSPGNAMSLNVDNYGSTVRDYVLPMSYGMSVRCLRD